MKPQRSLFNLKDFIAYFLVAGTGFGVQVAVGSVVKYYSNSYRLSLNVGYIVSFAVGFVLTKLFAFDVRNTAQTQREMVKFSMVAVLSYFITVEGAMIINTVFTMIIGQIFYEIPIIWKKQINVNEIFSLVMASGLSFLNNFILHKRFTFRSTGFYDRGKKKFDSLITSKK